MADAADDAAVITEALHDMGLDDETTAKCLMLLENARYTELFSLLNAHRQSLLESVHGYSDRIDCLDYFTYSLRKNGGI